LCGLQGEISREELKAEGLLGCAAPCGTNDAPADLLDAELHCRWNGFVEGFNVGLAGPRKEVLRSLVIGRSEGCADAID
jgi:hypothetical protein